MPFVDRPNAFKAAHNTDHVARRQLRTVNRKLE
jgi:hypothetical protein